ncbi:M17 family peptidase N-terminal domain-containing protein, partial [Nocardioides kongjuensis]
MSSADAGPVLPGQVSPPEFAASELLPGSIKGVDVVALPVLPGDDGGLLLGPGAAELADELGMDLVGIAEVHGLTGASAEVAVVPVPEGTPSNPALRVVLLVGVGAARPIDLRRAGAAMARAARDRAAVVTSIPAVAEDTSPDDPIALEAFVAGTMLGSFVFHWRSTGPEHQPVRRVVLSAAGTDRAALERAVALGGAGWRSRLLATVPSNLKNPAWLATQAEEIAQASGLDVRIWDERDLARDGFGGILAVGAASATPPRLIRLDYTPAG